jgi:hypothetical protein
LLNRVTRQTARSNFPYSSSLDKFPEQIIVRPSITVRPSKDSPR